MYLTTHAAAGILIATVFPDTGTAFLAGISSHFLLDMIPHEHADDIILEYPKTAPRQSGVFRRRTMVSMIDISLAIVVIAAAAGTSLTGEHGSVPPFTIIAAGIAGGLLPDIVVMLTFVFDNPFLQWYHRLHCHTHFAFSRISVPRPLSAAYQLLLTGIFLVGAAHLSGLFSP